MSTPETPSEPPKETTGPSCVKCASKGVTSSQVGGVWFSIVAFGTGGPLCAGLWYLTRWHWAICALIGGSLGFVLAGLLFGNYQHKCAACGHEWRTSL